MDPGIDLVVDERNDRAEALHRGHAVVLAADGSERAAWGDPSTGTYWRSAAKPLQAVPFVATGACDALGLGASAVALACGSHSSEPRHIEVARATLAAAGVDASALLCASHVPLSTLAGREPADGWQPVHNNCSGKHAAMLATCVHNDWPTGTYLEPDHPLQVAILDHVATATGLSAADVHCGVDGCGVPTFHTPVVGIARAFQWLHSDGAGVGHRVLGAMAERPEMVAGTDRLCTDLPRATSGRVVGKTGAMGVYGAIDRERGEAIAVKVTSGSRLAGETAAVAVMRAAGWLDEAELKALAAHAEPPVTNHAGRVVGRRVAVLDGEGSRGP